MAFTNSETVRQHLSQAGAVRDTFTDVPVKLLAASPVALLHANLKSGTVCVKGKEIGTPRYQSVTFVATGGAGGAEYHSRQRGGRIR